MSDFMHKDPFPPDQRTPPPTPLPQQGGGEPDEPGVSEDKMTQVDAAYHTAFEVGNVWSMPQNPMYKQYLCNFMAFAHNHNFTPYPKNTKFTREQLLQTKL